MRQHFPFLPAKAASKIVRFSLKGTTFGVIAAALVTDELMPQTEVETCRRDGLAPQNSILEPKPRSRGEMHDSLWCGREKKNLQGSHSCLLPWCWATQAKPQVTATLAPQFKIMINVRAVPDVFFAAGSLQ